MEDCKKRKTDVKSAILPLKTHARHLRTLSELDAAFGVPREEVTWRGGMSTRLDAQPDADVTLAEHAALKQQLCDWLNVNVNGIDITSERLNYRYNVKLLLNGVYGEKLWGRSRGGEQTYFITLEKKALVN